MRVKFLRDEQYENEGRNKGPIFLEGEVYDFTDEFGQRWVQRGAAAIIDADVQVTENTFRPVKGKKDEAAEKAAAEKAEAERLPAEKKAADDKAAADKAQADKEAAEKAAAEKARASRKI